LLAQFILDASHEFRNPLTVIQSSGELLNRLVVEPKQQKYINRILQQSNRILRLVEHLVQLSRVENTTSLHLVPVDLSAILKKALAQRHSLIAENNLHLQLDIFDETITVFAEADDLTL
jgi:signal transduction histidine kinase